MTRIENILRQHILFRQQSILPKLPHDLRSLLVFWPEAWRNSISVDSSSSDGTLLLLLLKLPVGVTSTGNKQTFFTTLKWISLSPRIFNIYHIILNLHIVNWYAKWLFYACLICQVLKLSQELKTYTSTS